MIYFKRIFFIVSCVLFSFLIWNFWNTHFSINQSNLQINNYLNKINDVNNDNQDQLVNVECNVLPLNINSLLQKIEHPNSGGHNSKINTSSIFNFLSNKKKNIYRNIIKFIYRQVDYIKSIRNPIYVIQSRLNKLPLNPKLVRFFIKLKSKGYIFYKKIVSLIQVLYKPCMSFIDRYIRYYRIYNILMNELRDIQMFFKKKNFLEHLFINRDYKKTVFIDKKENSFIYHIKNNYNIFVMKLLSQINNVNFNNFYKVFYTIQVKPKIQNKTSKVSKNLESHIKHKWLYIITYPLLKLLIFFYSILNNWGLTIIIVTILLKIITYPITKLQYISVLKMKLLQSKIRDIKNQFKNDSDIMNKKILSLYQSKKINPFMSLFFSILQAPIFLAFYYVLVTSVTLHHAPFLWIHDLSSYDPYYFLPICIGLSVFLTQLHELNFNNIFKQKNFLRIIPILFTGFFIWLPSGLALYYLTSNLVNYLQQRIIRHNFIKKNI